MTHLPKSVELCTVNGTTFYGSPDCLYTPPGELDDPEYADVDEDGQLALGVAGEQRAIPGLAAPRRKE